MFFFGRNGQVFGECRGASPLPYRGIFEENSVVSPFVRFSAQTLGVKCGRNRLDVHAPTGEKTTMNNYVIIRLDKLNSTASIRRSLKHAFREQDTPNADPARLSGVTSENGI